MNNDITYCSGTYLVPSGNGAIPKDCDRRDSCRRFIEYRNQRKHGAEILSFCHPLKECIGENYKLYWKASD